MDGDNESELLAYREKVVAELERRALRMGELQEQIRALEFALDSAHRGRKMMVGGVARIQVEAAHKAKLKQDLRLLWKDRDLAASDLQKAESRLIEVDRRLEDLRKQSNEE